MSALLPSSTTCPRTIFFTNLVILGFDPSIHATGTYASITFDKDMFSRGNNNVKAMELVVWFLFDILDQELAKERFISCWPTTTNINSREFRNIAFKWIEQMKKDNHLSPPDIVIRRSFFDECRGERFERIMLALSTYAVKKVLERNFDGKNKVPRNDFETLRAKDQVEFKRQLQASIHMQSEAFIARTSKRHQVQLAWKERALEIERRFHEFAITNNEITEAHAKLREAHPNLSDYITETLNNLTMEELEELRDQNVESVTGLWEEVLGFIGESEKKRKILEDVINDRANKFRLDGKAAKLEIPEEFVKMWNTEFQKGQITPYRPPNNNLDLISLLTIWKLSLRTFQSKPFSSSNIKNEHISGLEVLLTRFQQQRITVASLKNQLQERKNKIKSRVEELKRSGEVAICRDIFYGEKRQLDLLKPLPPFSLTCEVPEIATRQLSKGLFGTAQGMSDAISEIDKKVWSTVRKKEAIETETSTARKAPSPLKSPLRTAADKENRPIKKVLFSASTLDRDNANQKAMASTRITSLFAKFDEIAKKKGLNGLSMGEPTGLPHPNVIPKTSNSSTTRPKVVSTISRINYIPGRTVEVAVTEKTPISKKKTTSRIADSVSGGLRRRADENEKMGLKSTDQDTARAYDILADQIVAHVVGEDDPSSITPMSHHSKRSIAIAPESRQSRYSDIEDEGTLNDLIRRRASQLVTDDIDINYVNNNSIKTADRHVTPHGITDPIEALGINAFHARHEIPRTPPVHPVRSVIQAEGLAIRTPDVQSRTKTSKYSGQSSGTVVSWNTPIPTRTVSESAKSSPILRSALKNRNDKDGLSGSPSSLTVGSPPRGPVRFAGIDTEPKSVEQKMLQEISRQWGDSSPAFMELRRQMPSASPILSPSSRSFQGNSPIVGHRDFGSPSLFRKDVDLSKQLVPVSPLSPGFHNFISMERARGPPPEKVLSPPRKGIREELWRAREEMNTKIDDWGPDLNLEDDTWVAQDHETSLLDFNNILDEGGNIELEVFDEDVPSEIFETREAGMARW